MKKSIRAAAAAMLIPILLTLTGCSLTVDGVMSVIAPTETGFGSCLFGCAGGDAGAETDRL